MAGRSTLDTQFDTKASSVTSVIDIERTFDNITIRVITWSLVRYNTPLPIVDHILPYRISMEKKGRRLIQGSVDSGCLQRGLVSPLVWILVVDELQK